MPAAVATATTRLERSSGLTRRALYEQLKGQLKTERSSFEPSWRELADYEAPRRIRLTTTDVNKGDRRTSHIIDSTALKAMHTLQSGLHAGITSPARPWFRLTTPDSDLAEQGDVKQWLHTVTTRMHTVFLRSNLYNALPILYGDLGVFGTGAMALLEDEEDMLRAYAYPMGSYLFGLDARGVATTFIREYQLTVRQLTDQFGGPDGGALAPGQVPDWSQFSIAVRTLYENGNREARVEVCWIVTPNDEYNPNKLESKYAMRWRSCYYEAGAPDRDFGQHGGFLRESGFRTFPFLCPRWDVTGEDTWGTNSPGWTILGDVKQLQFMQKKKARAIDKGLDPPLKAHPNLKNQKVSLNPGDITYTDQLDAKGGLLPIHEVRLEGLQWLHQDMGETRERIREGCFADLFQMLAQSDNRQPITAEEVRARQEEKLVVLGPVLERLNDELLDPMIDRVFDIMQAAGAIPDPPPALEGLELKVEYVSIMAQAQKLVGVVGMDRFVTTVMGMAEIAPEVLDKVDFMQVVDAYGDKLGVDPKIVRPDDEAQARAQQRQQAQAAAQQAEQLKTMAQGAQALGNTPTRGGQSTALEDVAAAAAA